MLTMAFATEGQTEGDEEGWSTAQSGKSFMVENHLRPMKMFFPFSSCPTMESNERLSASCKAGRSLRSRDRRGWGGFR